MFCLSGAWFASPGTYIARSGPGELAMVLTTMMSLAILAGVAIYTMPAK